MDQPNNTTALVPPIKTSKTLSYSCIPITSNQYGTDISMHDYIVGNKWHLYTKNLLRFNGLEISIKKIHVLWCPTIEPLCSAKVTMKLMYHNSGVLEEGEYDKSLCASATGLACEQLGISISPCCKTYYRKGKADALPWSVELDTNCTSSENETIIGFLKIWFPVTITETEMETKIHSKMFCPPKLSCSNVFYPYYSPFMIFQTPRGFSITGNLNEHRSRSFSEEIISHVSDGQLTDEELWTIKNILTYQDLEPINKIKSACHQENTGDCVCGPEFHNLIRGFITGQSTRAYTSYGEAKHALLEVNRGSIYIPSNVGFHETISILLLA